MVWSIGQIILIKARAPNPSWSQRVFGINDKAAWSCGVDGVIILTCNGLVILWSVAVRHAVWLVAPPRHLEPGQNDLEPWISEHVCNFSRQMHYKIHKHSMPFSHMNTFATLALIHASCLTLTRLKIDAGVSASLSGYNYGTTVELWQFSYHGTNAIQGRGDEESLGGRQPDPWTTWTTYLWCSRGIA